MSAPETPPPPMQPPPAGPPPVQPPFMSTPLTPTSTFPRQAATFSVLAPLVAICINLFITPNVRGDATAMIVVGSIGVLLFPLGLVMGIAALVSMRRHGRQGAFGRAVAGVCICGVITLFIIVSAPMVFRHMQRIKEKHQMEQRHR